MARSVLFVTDSDSNVKFATSFGRRLSEAGLETRTVYVGRDIPSLGQAANAVQDGAKVDVVSSFATLFSGRDLLRYDVVFVLITGLHIKEFCANLNLLALTYGVAKPVTIGGFIGEWISANAQVAERAALDVFVVNRADELEPFREICGRAGQGKSFVTLPYGFLVRHGFAKPLAPAFDYDLAKTIVFADQVQVPRAEAERAFLYENLEAIARRAPELKIYFCARETEGGITRHRSMGGIAEHDSGAALAALPNVHVEYGTFQKRLPEADVVLSVSSTAGVEALINGVPALFLRGFQSSGAEKFAHTGLLIDVFELKSPKTFTLDPAFHAEIGRTDVWDAFVDLVRSQPTRAGEAPPAKRSVRTSLIAVPSLQGRYENLVIDVLGFDAFDQLDAPVPQIPLDLVPGVASVRGKPAAFTSVLTVDDAPRLPARDEAPVVVATSIRDYAADAVVGVRANELSIHAPVDWKLTDRFELTGDVDGEPLKIVVADEATTVTFIDPGAIQLQTAAYGFGDQAVTVFRLRAFVPVEARAVRIVRALGDLPPAWIAHQPSFVVSRLGGLAPELVAGEIALPPHDKSGLVSVLKFSREAAGHSGPLFTFTDAHGRTLEIGGLTGQRLGVALNTGNQTIRKTAGCDALDVTVAIIATKTMTMVMLNENLLVFETPFTPARLAIDGAAKGGLSVGLFANFAADVSLTQANALIEQLLLRFYSDPSYAKKHRAMPDFRTPLETRLGRKPAAVAVKAAPAAKAAPSAKAAPAAQAAPLAKPAKGVRVSDPQSMLAADKAAAAAKADLAPSSEMARIMEPYLDFVTATDLAEAYGIAKQSKSQLLFSQRFLREKAFGKALAVSVIAADRTPTSKAHMLVCAEALAELGAADRAEVFLRKAEILAPNDGAVRSKAAQIRGQKAKTQSGGLGGLMALIRRTIGR